MSFGHFWLTNELVAVFAQIFKTNFSLPRDRSESLRHKEWSIFVAFSPLNLFLHLLLASLLQHSLAEHFSHVQIHLCALACRDHAISLDPFLSVVVSELCQLTTHVSIPSVAHQALYKVPVCNFGHLGVQLLAVCLLFFLLLPLDFRTLTLT